MKSVWGVCAFVVAAGLLSVATPSAQGGTIVVRPTADLTLFAAGRPEPGQGFLVVGGNRAGRAYLRWQLPAGATVERARLELYTPTGGRGLRVHAGRAHWSEKALPPRNPQGHRLVGAFANAGARSWLKLDVTRFARGGGSVSFVVSKTGREARLVSREGAAAFRPRLLLVLNAAPLCHGGDRAGTEDTRLTGSLACTDDGALRYRKAADPAHGRVEVAANGEFTYTPAANFHGTDTVALEACEAAPPGRCADARLQLRIAPVNDAPVAGELSITTAEEARAEFGLVGSDVDGDALTYSLASQPAQGFATLSGSGAIYTPAANFNGADSFVYVVSDGHGGTAGATVSVNVTPVNDAPTAAGQTATTAEDTAKALSLGATDVDGDPLVYEIVSGPTHGTLAGLGTARTYAPRANFNGADSFTFRVSDGTASSNVATIGLIVTAVNDAPVAQGGSAAVEEDAGGGVTLTAFDVDGDPVTFTIVAAPAHGVLTGAGAERTYTPDPDYNGPDSFTYTASDGTADSNVATVALSVSEVNDAPTTSPDERTTDEDTVLQFAAETLVANDAAGPANEAAQGLTVTAVESRVGGTVEINAGEVTFTPATNFNGAASFSYTVADDGQTGGAVDPKTGAGTVNVVIAPANDPPVADLVAAAVNEDEGGAITLSATDADGDPLAYNVVVHPSKGSVAQPVGDQVTYTPVADYAGPDSFAFIASDGLSDSELGLVSVDVTSINDAPVLDASGSPQLTPVNANASNPAGDTVAGILASGAGGDPVSDVDSDNVGIAVTAVDEANGAWEYKPAGGTWSPLAGADAAFARLLAVDSRLRFVPAPGFSGDATFQFRAWDQTTGSAGGTADATTSGGSSAFSAAAEIASITVIANSLPAPVDDTKTIDEDTPVIVDVLANDSDIDGDALAVSDVTQPTEGTATIVDGAVRYAPDADANGTDQLTYTVSDGRGGTATGKVSLLILAVNDVPIARDDNEFVAEDGSVVVDPRENDLAGPREENAGPLSVPTITGAPSPAEGAASVISTGLNAGKIRFTPATGFTGSTGVLYEVCDDGAPALCSEAAVSVTVSRVTASAETQAVPHAGLAMQDSADDAAIWVDPNDPSRSVVVGTNKYSDATTNGGLAVYDLSGNQLQYTNEGRTNNVDLRSGFTLAGSQVTLVTASQRTDGTVAPPRPKRIAVYTLDPSTRTLAPIHSFTPTYEPIGDCMYRSATTGNFFVFVVAANGWVEQWRLSESPSGSGQIEAANVRTFRVSSAGSGDIAEGCVADDGLGHLYISEEDVALWRYSAEPDGGEARTQVDAVGGGQLTADIEGLAIAYGPGDTGFLIASSQGSNSYSVYRREGGNAFVRSFKVKDGALDGTTVTDGIDVTSASLGPAFPNGAFVAQDNNNAPDNQNFKLVPLEQIVPTAGLGSNGSCARPYTDSSPWNTPISAGSVVHPDSGMHVAALGGPLTSNPAQFTFPVYLVDASTPRETVTLTGWYSNVTNSGRTLVNQREGTVQLPIPAGAEPAAGSDAQMIMIDPLTGEEWGFSRAARDPTTGAWTGWNAYHYSTRWSGVPPYDATGRPFVPRGAGMPYLAGLVRPCELARGRIDHAIAFAYDFPTKQFVYPATKSDGQGPGSPDLPEGSRLQLDPALTAADLAALGCAGHCLTIARALQVYGMYVVDNSRRPKIMVEYEGTAAWGGAMTAATVSPIPMSSFRLLSAT